MKFKVGDVCVIKRCALHRPTPVYGEIGHKVTILGFGVFSDYAIESCGERMYVDGCCLELKRPPEQKREQLGEWELCPWRPVTTPVTECA